MNPEPYFCIVFNGRAGHGDSDEDLQAITGVFEGAGRPHEVLRPEDPTGLVQTAKRAVSLALERGGAVIAAGGDGTLSTVAHAALESDCPFGVIPLGTFNYFGRAHGISQEPAEAARALLRAHVEPAQVGLINGRVFLVNASLGLYPQSLEERESAKRKHGRSRLVAAWAAVGTALRGFRPLNVEMERDGRPHSVRTLTVFVGNNSLQLEQMGLDAGVLERGKLEAIVLKPVSVPRLLWLMIQGMAGRLGAAQGVETFPLTRLMVRNAGRRKRMMKVALDGEVSWMKAPIEFRVSTDPLQLLAADADRPA